MLEIISYRKCKCGALTIELSETEDSKTIVINFKGTMKAFCQKYNIEKPSRSLKFGNYYSCNYCDNNWGLDLCGCGSGEKFGKCKNKIEECNFPAQSLDANYISPCDINFGSRVRF